MVILDGGVFDVINWVIDVVIVVVLVGLLECLWNDGIGFGLCWLDNCSLLLVIWFWVVVIIWLVNDIICGVDW